MKKLTTLVLVTFALMATGCASTLVKAEKVVRTTIDATEQNRCTVHPAPCLTEQQFKDANAALYRVAVAGSHATAVEAVHAAKPEDYKAFYDALVEGVKALKATGVGGAIGSALDALVKAQSDVQAYLQKHGG